LDVFKKWLSFNRDHEKDQLNRLQVDDRTPEKAMCFEIQHVHFTSILVRGQTDRVLLQCKRDREKERTAYILDDQVPPPKWAVFLADFDQNTVHFGPWTKGSNFIIVADNMLNELNH
jgi:hypothetical protein